MDQTGPSMEGLGYDHQVGRSLAEIEYMAEIYRKYGKHDLADELFDMLAQQDSPSQTNSEQH